MRKSYLTTGLAIAIYALAIGAMDVILSLIYWLATGAKGAYLPALSNLLFVEGVIIFLAGCLIAFFRISGSEGIYEWLMSPLKTVGIHVEKEDGTGSGEVGWLLIFLGTALIVLSLAASLEFLI